MISILTSKRISIGTLVGLVFLSSWAPEVFGQLRVRRNYSDLSPAEREKFRDALVEMKNDATDTGGLWVCSMPAANVGKICSTNPDCDTTTGSGDGVCDTTAAALCEWANKYDKYVCWHDQCG